MITAVRDDFFNFATWWRYFSGEILNMILTYALFQLDRHEFTYLKKISIFIVNLPCIMVITKKIIIFLNL